MNQKEIIDGNKLIAEFMGYEKEQPKWSPYERYLMPIWDDKKLKFTSTKWSVPDIKLPFNKDFNTLMSVVEKIEKTGYGYDVMISSDMESDDIHGTMWHQGCIISDGTSALAETTSDSKIESVWAAVIDFIEFYNLQTINA